MRSFQLSVYQMEHTALLPSVTNKQVVLGIKWHKQSSAKVLVHENIKICFVFSNSFDGLIRIKKNC